MDSRKQFEEWLKNGLCVFNDAEQGGLYAAWQAGRASMRDEAAKKCIKTEFKSDESPEWDAACQECHSEVMKIQP